MVGELSNAPNAAQNNNLVINHKSDIHTWINFTAVLKNTKHSLIQCKMRNFDRLWN